MRLLRPHTPLPHHPTPPHPPLYQVRSNLIYYGLLAGIGLAGILLLLFKELLKPSNVLGFCIAFSNAYGLIAGRWPPVIRVWLGG